MHIHDFHSKLTSVNEEGHLFEALRGLSQIADPRAMLDSEGDSFNNWPTWPAMDAHAAGKASEGV